MYFTRLRCIPTQAAASAVPLRQYHCVLGVWVPELVREDGFGQGRVPRPELAMEDSTPQSPVFAALNVRTTLEGFGIPNKCHPVQQLPGPGQRVCQRIRVELELAEPVLYFLPGGSAPGVVWSDLALPLGSPALPGP